MSAPTKLEQVACITGGRYDADRRPLRPSLRQLQCFRRLLTILDIHEVWDGDAIGTDRFVRGWIKSRFYALHIACEICPVDNKLDGPWPAAGHRRNHRMLNTSRASRLIAFPGGRGTNGCVQAALKMGLEVWQWSDDAGDFVLINQ